MGLRLFQSIMPLFLLLVLTCTQAPAQNLDSITIHSLSANRDSVVSAAPVDPVAASPTHPVIKPKRRLVAALLCVALGPFGMHRLYLGTKPHVAAAYTLTLGGGIGLVPLIDLFHIVFDPNLYKYKDNDKFIMWLK